MYVTNYDSRSVTKCTGLTGPASCTSFGSGSGFSRPTGIAIYGTDAYITDYGNSKLYKCSLSTTSACPAVVSGLDGAISVSLFSGRAYVPRQYSQGPVTVFRNLADFADYFDATIDRPYSVAFSTTRA